MLNSLEYFVHHEDIRRAQPAWTARDLGDDVEKTIWSMAKMAGKGLTKSMSVGVTAENATTGSRVTLSAGSPEVTIRGLPSEVMLFLFGRKSQADVELLGDDEAVAALSDASLGFCDASAERRISSCCLPSTSPTGRPCSWCRAWPARRSASATRSRPHSTGRSAAPSGSISSTSTRRSAAATTATCSPRSWARSTSRWR